MFEFVHASCCKYLMSVQLFPFFGSVFVHVHDPVALCGNGGKEGKVQITYLKWVTLPRRKN